MGCGSVVSRVAPGDACWLPSDQVPILLSEKEQDEMWDVWHTEVVKTEFNRGDALRACAEYFGCTDQEYTLFVAIVDPSNLTFKQACAIIGMLLHGDFRSRARLMFEAVDLDGNEALDLTELETVVRLAVPPSSVHDDVFFRNVAREIMNVADTDGDNLVDFPEWQLAMPHVTGTLARLNSESRSRNRSRYEYRRKASGVQRQPSGKGIERARRASVQIRRQSLQVIQAKTERAENGDDAFVTRVSTGGSASSGSAPRNSQQPRASPGITPAKALADVQRRGSLRSVPRGDLISPATSGSSTDRVATRRVSVGQFPGLRAKGN
eukprot:TRINITY_DN47803_c0_g1_i1.p1 TRINITY_DN47803_c0_g1~~TRINITY_DN47803_c0_g1_i1.p1  ORF type:complete len:323 (+),score=31.18 TRINITY_DN47803_c0_g1_i1:72-1040(+)